MGEICLDLAIGFENQIHSFSNNFRINGSHLKIHSYSRNSCLFVYEIKRYLSFFEFLFMQSCLHSVNKYC